MCNLHSMHKTSLKTNDMDRKLRAGVSILIKMSLSHTGRKGERIKVAKTQ